MLEQYFKLPAVLRRHRSGLLGPYLDSFVSVLGSLGYPRETVRHQCCAVRDLGVWLERQKLGVADLDDDLVGRHIEDRRRNPRTWRGDEAATVRRLVEHLRELGVIASAKPVQEHSPVDDMVRRYTEYLLVERAVAQATVDNYVAFVRNFLVHRFGDEPLQLGQLRERDVTDYVLCWVRSHRPGRAKLLVTVLRSFFRFLLEHGEIERDLAVAVPTVAGWRLSTVPKYLSENQGERLLDACDRTTATGRRDYAVLLLLSRLGLRAGEVVALEIDDIDWRAGEISVRGKGSHHDRLPLPPDVGDALAEYLRQDRSACTTRRLFVRLRAPHCGFAGSGAIISIVRRALRRANLNPPVRGAHLLRHSLATGMLRKGASMAEIGQVLRHRSPSTTEIYAKVDFDALRALARPWPISEGG
jgi:site-specific recombinase XerD